MEITIGQRIKERRKELKITQTRIQQETSISSGNLSCIENGKYLPSAIALLELSKILNCSVDWILTGKTAVSENANFLDTEEAELINSFRELPEDEKEELLYLLRLKVQKVKKDITAKSSHSIDTETNNMIS